MTVPPGFALHHYGEEIVMFADCIVDLITDLLTSCTVSGNESSEASVTLNTKETDSGDSFPEPGCRSKDFKAKTSVKHVS